MSESDIRQATYALDGGDDNAAEAREYARAFFADAVPSPEAGLMRDILLAVSELVTNAVRHAPGPCALTLADDGRCVTIAVSDTLSVLPSPRPADLAGGGGLGWYVLTALGGDINAQRHSGGKTVSIVLDRLRESAGRRV
jgi:anti-sigma regulatory factor (Ser/Thr protein kinase)